MKNGAQNPAFLAFLLFFAVFVMASTPSATLAAKKHASLVIDANSGKVLHADNISDMRYPASLTKLMTLYMTFDALRTGRLKMGTVLKASKKAAKMPSTNLRMKPGDRITVRDAIKALVVRSANDVSVILAEKLGGSEYKFAKRMTATARRLGMKNTTFKNASGLPHRQQKTTARDLAVLALALRRHYPQYYHFFRTQSFKYKKKLYKSHNKAMGRISGADGLKTGYIRASGFNLITSARRGGKSLVAIVLGGESSKARDNRMVNLVERTFARMNLQNNRRQFVLQNDPVPRAKPQELAALAKKLTTKTAESAPKTYVVAESVQESKRTKPEQYVRFDFSGSSKAEQNTQFNPPAASSVYDREMAAYKKMRGQFMPVSYNPVSAQSSYQVKPSRDWGIQVGAYEEQREALVAASNAASMVPSLLSEARIYTGDTQPSEGRLLHRARLADMNEVQARKACAILSSLSAPCFVFRQPNSNI